MKQTIRLALARLREAADARRTRRDRPENSRRLKAGPMAEKKKRLFGKGDSDVL